MNSVEIEGEALVKMLKHVEVMIQTLHRIGSFYAEDPARCSAETAKAVEDFDFCGRLVKVRRILLNAGEKAIDTEEWERVEQMIGRARHWRGPI